MTTEKDLLFLRKKYDWNEIDKHFDWIRNLKNCPQDKIYHVEGDVWIHTKMVVENLLDLQEFKELNEEQKGDVFAACLLHDVAKPPCTVIENNGRITSAGHAKMGEKVARNILEDFDLTFAKKEQICKWVRHHGLPLWFLEKPNPQKSVIMASLLCDTRLLAMIAEADVKGRICEDKDEMLLKIDLFRELCKENDCYGKPKQFVSDHSRFMYFQKENYAPDYEVFDDRNFTVYVMCGLPGVGKNHYIQQHLSHLPVIALDDIREELDLDFTDNQGKVLQLADERAKELLRKKQSFVWNATNIIKQRRKKIIDMCDIYKAKIVIIHLIKPLSVIFSQNKQREIQVKDNIILRFHQKFEPPHLTEAHEVLRIE